MTPQPQPQPQILSNIVAFLSIGITIFNENLSGEKGHILTKEVNAKKMKLEPEKSLFWGAPSYSGS